jgi:hypothetical protein
MGEGRTDEPRDEPQANQRLTVAQAAAALDITEGAVRSRIKRGTLPTLKEGGTVYVVLGGTSEATHTPHADEPSDQSELVESLQDQITYLRQQLAAERDANSENRRLLAAALERIPAIEAPQEAAESTESAEPQSDRGTTPEEQQEPTSRPQEERSWWRRMFGG